jgi:hypothetical protein
MSPVTDIALAHSPRKWPINLLITSSELAMMAAIFSLFLPTGTRMSAGFTTLWISLEALRRTRDTPWSWGLLAILLLNIRGIVVGDGPQPVSHMDYVLMITAFLLGYGRSSKAWQRSAALCCIGCALGVLLRFEVIWDFARWGIEYQTPILTKNQTALLGGFASSCGLMALFLSEHRRWWPALIPSTGLCLLLSYATTSRAALALTPLSLAIGLLISWRGPISQQLNNWWNRHWRGISLAVTAAGVAGLAGLVSMQQLMHGTLLGRLAAGYGQENLENDLSRLKVYSCYAGLPFKGENRFLYGVGYQNSWEKWCTPEVLGRQLSHAHNLLLQIWGDTGAISTLFLLICAGLILLRLWRNGRALPWRTSAGITISFVYLASFNMVELGMMKVPVLMAGFGYFIAAVYVPIAATSQDQP